MKKFLKIFVLICALILAPLTDVINHEAIAASPSAGSVVINEIGWMGTQASANDEWIELYNTTNQNIDLTNWVIDDDNGASIYTISSGIIQAQDYFLIEDTEETISNKSANLVIGLSLSNTGDSLILKDEAGTVVDSVDAAGGAWYAGDSTNKLSMERIDALNLNDIAGNWANNTASNNSLDRLSNIIQGTPGSINSVSQIQPPPQVNPRVTLAPSNAAPFQNDQITITANIAQVNDLFAYGFDISYNPNVLDFQNAAKEQFLSNNGLVQTSFNSALENGIEGKVVIAEARTTGVVQGISGSGALFTVTFNVIGNAGTESAITIEPTSFLADSNNDIIYDFANTNIQVKIKVVNPVQNLTSQEGLNRYEIKLNWQAPIDGAETYRILRKDSLGNFVEIGVSPNLEFVDKDGVNLGGNLIPNNLYEYKVIAVNGAVQSEAAATNGTETRGIKGDNNRSDKVDGRDLERLARHFTEDVNDPGFIPLIDTTYDSNIDGNDLLDIAANFGLKFL